jgi:hypothetical protein
MRIAGRIWNTVNAPPYCAIPKELGYSVGRPSAVRIGQTISSQPRSRFNPILGQSISPTRAFFPRRSALFYMDSDAAEIPLSPEYFGPALQSCPRWTARQRAKPIDYGLASLDSQKSALHVAQPRKIFLAWFLPESMFGVFEFPI